jgi:hypothetical protein
LAMAEPSALLTAFMATVTGLHTPKPRPSGRKPACRKLSKYSSEYSLLNASACSVEDMAGVACECLGGAVSRGGSGDKISTQGEECLRMLLLLLVLLLLVGTKHSKEFRVSEKSWRTIQDSQHGLSHPALSGAEVTWSGLQLGLSLLQQCRGWAAAPRHESTAYISFISNIVRGDVRRQECTPSLT